MAEHIVTYRDAPLPGEPAGSGREYKLDLTDGRLYDLQGNCVEKWTPADTKNTALLADFVAEEAVLQTAYSLSCVEPGRARAMLAKSRMDPDRLITMDLGPQDVHVAGTLPNFASGYRNEPPVADILSCVFPVQKTVDNYYQFDKKDAFQRATPIGASGGAGVGEVTPRFATAQYSTKERALGGWVSTEVDSNQDAALNILQATARRVFGALTIEREIRVKTLMQTAANWDSSVVATIAAGSQWNGGASSNPIQDIHTAVAASWGAVSGIVMALPVFQAFQRNAVVRSYYGNKTNTSSMPGADEVSRILDLPPIYVGKMQYMDSATTKAYVWGTGVVLFRNPDQMPPTTQEDVASSYTFRANVTAPSDGTASGGFIVRQFFTQDRGTLGGNKIVVVHNDDEKLTSAFAGGLLVSAYQ